ncbi:amino acid adenylation domain-containing protein [Actinomadura nitritigenes]|uniref:amino acid adenylation domain-containing protein n=1 Tax=Actinomadura nitritigenes TaxID=134602 RepID=UPI003D90886A
MSFAQQGLWFLSELDPPDAHLNLPVALQLTGSLQVPALRGALDEIVTRHEVLRTTFSVGDDGTPLQVIAPPAAFDLPIIDLSGLPLTEARSEARRRVDEDTARPFDLRSEPPVRAFLLRLAADEHVLFLNVHHVAFDQWSSQLLQQELATLYAAFRDGRPSPLAPLPIQYADYAAWQLERLSGPGFDDQIEYWRRQLADVPALQLPTDRPHPSEGGHAGALHEFSVPTNVSQRLRALSRNSGTSLFMVLLAGFQALLARYCGQDDVAVGTPIAGRSHPDTEALIGLFINTLVLRTDLSGDPTFEELLGRVRKVALEAYANQDVPFSRVVDELGRGRDTRSELFDVLFSYQADTARSGGPALTGVGSCDFPITRTTSQFDLAVELVDDDGELYGAIEYSTELFDSGTISRLADHLTALLNQVSAVPKLRVSEIDLIGDDERERLATWGEGPEASVPGRFVHELISELAMRHPERAAVVSASDPLDYRRLDETANRLAHHLRELGAGPETIIAVCLDRGPDLIIALLAVWKAGAGYLPLAAGDPDDRLSFELTDSDAQILITTAALHGRLPGRHQAVLIDGTGLRAELASRPAAPPVVDVHADSTAYLIYTSGSTGTPKAVTIRHGGLANLVAAQRHHFGLTGSDRILQFYSAGFDASIWEFMLALGAGAALVIADENQRRSPEELVQHLAAQHVTLATLPPTLLAALSPDQVPTLHTLLATGEHLPGATAARWHSPDLRLINGYGPTETTIGVVMSPVESPTAMTAPPIGTPLAGNTALVLDAQLNPAPVGIPGELFIGGPQLARGYHRRPALTAERFVPNPHTGDGSRLYRTGDLARWRPDGRLEYLGRADTQIKIRGYRVEAAEVESALTAHPDVRSAAVVPHGGGSSARRLIAYLTTHPGRVPAAEELRGHMAARLPEHMIPAAFIVLDALPLTAGGKIDRRALPAPTERPRLTATYKVPSSPAEQELSAIWADVLGLDEVGVHDNFFDLGGDSILAIQVVTRARAAGLSFTPAQLFRLPTIAELAGAAETGEPRRADQAPLDGPIRPLPVHFWWAELDLPRPAHFNQTALLESSAPVDPQVLEQAVAAVADHHDALRLRATGYPAPLNISVAPAGRTPVVTRHRLSGLCESDQRAGLSRIAAGAQQGLNLDEGPIMRVELLERGTDATSWVLIVVHHLAVDTVSWAILLEDLTRAYRRLARGEAADLGAKTDSIRRWADYLAELAADPETLAETGLWTSPEHIDAVPLPVDHDTGPTTVASARTHGFSLDRARTESLLRVAPAVYHARVSELLLAAVAIAMRRWAGAERVLADLEGHGRTHTGPVDLTRTVGWFTTFTPVVLAAPTPDDPAKAVRWVKERLRALPQNGLSYGVLRYLAEPATTQRLSALPNPQVGFNYHGQSAPEQDRMPALQPQTAAPGGSDIAFAFLHGDTGLDQHPDTPLPHLLDISADVSGGRLHVAVTYPATRYRSDTIESLAGHLDEALGLVIDHAADGVRGATIPSDFPLANLTQPEIDHLTETTKFPIEDAYPLSPMQHGMLFHTLMEPGSGLYVQQVLHELDGPLDRELIRTAFQHLADRHPVLRTAVRHRGLQHPLQLVAAHVEVPFSFHDWTGLSAQESRRRLAELLETDRQRGLDLSAPPAARLTLISRSAADHMLVFSAHHLLMDGWSMELLTSELFDDYQAMADQSEAEAPARRPYRDFIAWLQEAEEDRQGHLAFWRAQLDGFTQVTPLAVEAPRSSTGHATHGWALPEDLSRALADFARAHDLTVNTIVRGILALLIAAYGGRRDVCFGATVAGRPASLPGAEEMIGLFINTIPVRAAVNPDEPLLAFFQGLQHQQLEQQDHQHTALVDIQAQSALPPNTPLFDTLLVFENYPTVSPTRPESRPSGPAEEAAPSRLQVCGSSVIEHGNYPLTVAVGPGVPLHLALSYDSARFSDEAIRRLADHLTVLFQDTIGDPSRRLGDYSLLTQTERTQITEWTTGPRPPQGAEGLVHDLIVARATATPDAVAAIADDDRLTYAELETRANRLARHLQDLGAGPETIVGVCLDPGLDLVTAQLAIWKAGGTYLPLDPAYPLSRLAFCLDDATASLLVTCFDLLDRLPDRPIPLVLLDDPATRESIASHDAASFDGGALPGNSAYLTYTSGSTGTPKAVATTHHGLAHLARAQQVLFGLTPADRVLQFASPGFDASIWETTMALTAGATLVIADADRRRSPERLAAYLADNGVSVATLPPTMLSELDPGAAPGLHTLIAAGERLPAATADRWSTPAIRLYNAYGPTETTVCATIAACSGDPRPPIGRPLPDTTCHVLDERLRQVPVGVTGELYVGGDQLTRGYHRRPALTAQRFVANPFAAGGTRLYRTGDLARWRPDGQLEFVGRSDQQIKVRGHRVEPGEVETAMTAHPDIDATVVVSDPDGGTGGRLVAYVVPAADAPPPTVSALRAHLADRLPESLVPASFVTLDALPLTAHGKVDFASLPAPGTRRPDLGAAYVPPSGPTEVTLAGVWRDVLGVDRVGARDNFFELGGHSLLATQVVTRLHALLDVDLPVSALFEAPTLQGFAAVAEAAARTEPLPPITRADRTAPLPLSHAQQRLWFLSRLDPDSAEYNVPTAMNLSGNLDVQALEHALSRIVARHEILRTTITVADDGVPAQVIHAPAPLEIPVTDLSDSDTEDVHAEARRIVEGDARRPFDLAAEFPLRVRLVELPGQEYVLGLTMHHSAFDELSVGVLTKELTELYAASRENRPAALPELRVQYADYAAWQRERWTGETLDRHMSYWRDQLADLHPLPLPTDRPRPAVRGSAGATVGFTVPEHLTEALRAMSLRADASMFMTSLAVFQVLLAAQSGADDIAVGTPVANRPHPDVEPLIGFFVNTVVLRTDTSGDPTFSEILTRVRGTALEAYAHQHVPFEHLVDVLQPVRDRSRHPLFQVMFTFDAGSDRVGETVLDDVDLCGFPIVPTVTQFDLTLNLAESGASMEGAVVYSTELFDESTVRRLIGRYLELLGTIADRPDTRLSELEIASHEEIVRLTEWGHGPSVAMPPRPVHELIAAQVEDTPDHIAVMAEGTAFTYRQLDERANRLANLLRASGAGIESVIAVCVPRGLDLITSLLSVWKAGGTYLPLDPDGPADRLAYELSDSRAQAVITTAELRPLLPRSGPRQVVIDEPDASSRPPADSAAAPDVRVHPASAAYLIYTSGSTGSPKAVTVPHGGLTNRLLWQVSAHAFTSGDRILHKSPATFDVSLWELCCPLLAGGTLVVAAPGDHRDPAALARTITESEVTVAHFVPSMFGPFLNAVEPRQCANLRLVVTSGEALPGALADRFHERLGKTGRHLRNLYGPTEASIDVTASLDVPSGGGTPPIGAPVANTVVLVLDRHLRPVPPGIPGELFLGGPQLARGYQNRSALTAERFVPDPAAADGSRLYRTGDLVRWRSDGQLDYLGRTDHQVKVRGQRIELGEIEHVLTAHPGVGAAVAAAHEATSDEPGGTRLVVYLVPADSRRAPGSGELRSFLGTRLPASMIPDAFVQLDAVPLTASGKVDRSALPAPSGDRPALTAGYEPPVTPTEAVLTEIWQDVLHVHRVGRRDDFFELGGHSLLATRITARIKAVLNVDLPVAAVFDAPTVAALAGRTDAATRGEALLPIPRADRGGTLPLSFAQQRLWFLNQLEPESPEYNFPTALHLTGALDLAALRRGLDEIVRRHEVLRTTITTTPGGVPVQSVSASPLVELAFSDLSNLAPDDARAEAQRRIDSAAAVPFDLSAGGPVRAELVRLSEREHVLGLTFHHIASDEWSAGIFARELSVLYEAFREGRPSPLEPLPIQYGDYAAWQRARLSDDVLEAQLAYWREKLADVPPLSLPTDRPYPPLRDPAGDVRPFTIPAVVTQRLRDIGRLSGASMFMTLLAAFQALLARYCDQDDIVVGTPVAGRAHPDAERLIGFFVNTLVLRADASGDPAFTEFLARVRATALEAYAHQDLPFEHLVEALAPGRDRTRHPIFQVMFSYGAPAPAGQNSGGGLADVDVCGFPIEYTATPYDLTLNLSESDGMLYGAFEYSTMLFDPKTIDRLVARFSSLLEEIATAPGRCLSELPLTTAEERAELADLGRGTAISPASGAAVHEMVSAHAATAPNKPAVVANGRTLSYRELEAQANRLAHFLRGLSPEPEAAVALFLGRSVDIAVAVLAVLKAGGVYVPMDEETPPDRLDGMLRDSGARTVLTTGELRARVPAVSGLAVVALDDPATEARLEALPPTPPDVLAHPDGGAYLIYTSGSTGTPKGALGTHRNLVQLHNAWKESHGLLPTDTWLTTASPAFDVFTGDWVRALATGGTLHIGPNRRRLDAAHLARLITHEGVTAMETTPRQLTDLRQHLVPEDGHCLRLLIVAADRWPAEDLEPTRASFPESRLLTAYGLTETTVDSTWHDATRADCDGGTVPIGRPLPHTAIHVLDPRMRPVPIGLAGEIYIGGPGVTRGYHGRPGLTAERFVPDPFSRDGGRLYRTGDLARWRDAGYLELLGRTDQQINLNGHRVEPGEVEIALTTHPCVTAAAVVPRRDPSGERLVAYLTATPEREPTVSELRTHLRARLPDHMIPVGFVTMGALPLTATGKIDRKALPAPEAGRPLVDAAYRAPGTATERTLAGIWRELLRIDRVGADDDFFDLGGHSLLATQVVSRTRSRLLVDLPVAAVFDTPTLSGLAEVVDTLIWVRQGGRQAEVDDEYEELEL